MKRKIIKANLGIAIPGVEEMVAGADLGELDQNYFNRWQTAARRNLKLQKLHKINNSNITSIIGDALGKSGQLFADPEGSEGYNQAYDIVSDYVRHIPVYGQLFSAGMKLKALGDKGLYAMGVGNDGMTGFDRFLNSSWTPTWLKIAGEIGSKTVDPFAQDLKLKEEMGSDYIGSYDLINKASQLQGKEFSTFSMGAYKSAKNTVKKADKQQKDIMDIRDNTSWRKIVARNTSQLHNTSYNTAQNGGFQPLRGYQKGGSLDNKLSKVKGRNYKKVTLKEPPTWEPTISLEIPDRSIEELIVEAKNQNPRFIQRMSEPVRYIKINKKDEQGNDYWESATHLMSNRDNKVYSLVQEIDGKLQLLNDDEAFDRANSVGNILTFKTNSEARTFAEDNYKTGWPEFFNSSVEQGKMESEINMFKDGGKLGKEEESEEQKNVIPDGALHKNKHHMEDAEGLTKKGIPVVDNEGEQHAEIEKEEIVFTLEVTKQLEGFLEQFNNEESKSKQDEIAIEAGKLLVEQILYNTDDKTNLIERVE